MHKSFQMVLLLIMQLMLFVMKAFSEHHLLHCDNMCTQGKAFPDENEADTDNKNPNRSPSAKISE